MGPFYEPKRKVDNRISALKHAERPNIAKRTLTAKKVLYAIFSLLFRKVGMCLVASIRM